MPNFFRKSIASGTSYGAAGSPILSDAIEQLSFLLFLKQLDEREQDAERAAKKRGQKFQPLFPNQQLRWSYWSQLPGDEQGLQPVQGFGGSTW